jgi:hypothetical protein
MAIAASVYSACARKSGRVFASSVGSSGSSCARVVEAADAPVDLGEIQMHDRRVAPIGRRGIDEPARFGEIVAEDRRLDALLQRRRRQGVGLAGGGRRLAEHGEQTVGGGAGGFDRIVAIGLHAACGSVGGFQIQAHAPALAMMHDVRRTMLRAMVAAPTCWRSAVRAMVRRSSVTTLSLASCQTRRRQSRADEIGTSRPPACAPVDAGAGFATGRLAPRGAPTRRPRSGCRAASQCAMPRAMRDPRYATRRRSSRQPTPLGRGRCFRSGRFGGVSAGGVIAAAFSTCGAGCDSPISPPAIAEARNRADRRVARCRRRRPRAGALSSV